MMKVFYYLNGQWHPFLSAREIVVEKDAATGQYRAAFTYNRNKDGKVINETGAEMAFEDMGLRNSLSENAVYFGRTSSEGAKFFAITEIEASTINTVKKTAKYGMLAVGLGLYIWNALRPS